MGVKGLQGFVENALPGTCQQVDLREMAEQCRRAQPGRVPTLAVDGMACLRHWYSCQAWVHGGQWQEYLHLLEEFVSAFTAVGICLVFFFDGVVEEDKRKEWVRRRLRVSKNIARVFQHIKVHGQQPGRDQFCLPSGLATFSMFALKSLGQETWSTVREADYEIASYALQHGCMGILGQDTDFLIFDTAPYLSISRLRLDRMSTVQLSREILCHSLRLHLSDLPLLACLLGNDIVPEHRLQRLRSDCIAEYSRKFSQTRTHVTVYALAEFISRNRPPSGGSQGIAWLPLLDVDRVLLEEGVQKYLLPGQRSPWVNSDDLSPATVGEMERFSSADIMQAAKEKHIKAECFMVYNVLCDGVVECSNTLEDEEDTQLLPQALLYRPAREHIYGLLLPTIQGSSPSPVVKEWFVFAGNLLSEPHLVSPVPLDQSGGNPDLSILWFGTDAAVTDLRVSTFLAIFDLQEFTEGLRQLDMPLMAVALLVIYISLQDSHLSLEDIDAYLSQAICVMGKSYTELLCTRVPRVDSRAVQLASLFIRGLGVLIAANGACGFPFSSDVMMPWKTFDGLLFHSKYLQAHCGSPDEELLEGNESWVSLFRQLRDLVLRACRKRGKAIHSAPRRETTAPEKPMGGQYNPTEKQPQHFRDPGQTCPLPQNYRPQNRGPRAGMQECGYSGRSRHPGRQRYRLAPRWPLCQSSQPYGPRPSATPPAAPGAKPGETTDSTSALGNRS
ncbi:hypothetical protein AAFF_G00063350 [Aldrovandia affinis]|uniref:Constitutive coactivator of peroxisome proliferator-activated receptor gamma n=1 Tax=Aldrovandia affinis TaxID=143900 RepID=A0AAD7RZM6_9TELE|nr:hypothetical protein AAFF_G00063350 [Aldrovandia affinis]